MKQLVTPLVGPLFSSRSGSRLRLRKVLQTAAGAVLGLACGLPGLKAQPGAASVGAGDGRTYYLSSSEGNDTNGGSAGVPWKTLTKISSVSLRPGDRVCFKRGDRFAGHFVVNGSGTELQPIVITAYGTGSKPVITGEVGAADGGDFQEAIYVNNHDNLVFDGLEVNNERMVSRSGVDDVDAYGMHFNNTGTKSMKNLTLRNMTFRKVYAAKPMTERADFDKIKVAAVHFGSAKNTRVGEEKNIQNVLIEDCYFTDIQRLGVSFNHGGGSEGVGDEAINRNFNIVVRDNQFHHLGGSCVLPNATYNCLIENNLFDHPGANVDPRMPGRGSAVWPIHCINTVIQHNRCLGTRGYADSCGLHIDLNNQNTFIQYNYMEDCEGGFAEILDGNLNAVYRFNISVNDGWRVSPPGTPQWQQGHTIWISDGHKSRMSEGTYIYNNTVYVDKDFPTSILIQGGSASIYNNIIYCGNGGKIGGEIVVFKDRGSPFLMSHNLFYGAVDPRFVVLDKDPILGDPGFAGKGSDSDRFQLSAGSPAINQGVAKLGPPIPGAGIGVFRNVPAQSTVDFYRNPVDLSASPPNIGACNAKRGELVSNDPILNSPKSVQ